MKPRIEDGLRRLAHPVSILIGPDTGQIMSIAADRIEEVRALHYPVSIEPSDTICHECSFQLPNGDFFGKVVEHPCPTINALDGDQ